jgi:hypothetical protein
MQNQIITERIPYTGITTTLTPASFLARAAPRLTPRQRYIAIVMMLPWHARVWESIRYEAVKLWRS